MKLYLLIFIALWIVTLSVQAQDSRSQLQYLANDLTKQIEAKGKKRVIISSFLNLENQETTLGRYMADMFSVRLIKANSSLQLTDRSQITQVLHDNKLGAGRILDPKTISTIGRLTGAEVIITGNYTALDNKLSLIIKAIDLERGITLAIAEGDVARTQEINKLLEDISNDSSVDSVNISGNSEHARKDADKRCATNHTGTYCFKNETKVDIRVTTSNADFTIHPGQQECNYGMNASSIGELIHPLYVYRNVKENHYEMRQIVITECQMKIYVVR